MKSGFHLLLLPEDRRADPIAREYEFANGSSLTFYTSSGEEHGLRIKRKKK
ncbi:MAG: hypothetical protein ACYCQJ_05730 [Nitrososphaerales archaeon]